MACSHSLLLAHHREDDRHRCAVVGGRDVCRRCLVLYPLLAATMVAVNLGVGAGVPAAWRNPLVWLLPLPAAVEYAVEAFGRVRYSPARQVLATVPLAVAGGAGFAWECREPDTVSFWSAVAVYGTAGLAVTVAGWRTRAVRGAEQRYRAALDAAEARLTAGPDGDRTETATPSTTEPNAAEREAAEREAVRSTG